MVTEVLSSAVDSIDAPITSPPTRTLGPAVDIRPLPGAPVVDHGFKLADVAAEALDVGLRRIQVLAWRDYEDAEAGGSELHAHRIASLWADFGIDVTLRSSTAAGKEAVAMRNGYRVVRKSGRYGVFPRSAMSGLVGRRGRPDGLVEVWNGMPFFSPVWARCPKIVVVHHVHAEMWRMVLSRRLARVGETIELRVAPPFYRRSRFVTVSESSKDDLVSMLGIDPARIDLVPNGIDERFTPGGVRTKDPLVVAVGRLVPVKRFELLVDALADARQFVPNLRAVIVGEGYERSRIEEKIRELGADEWLALPGRLSDDELLAVYRQAWVVASTSLREGWNLTLSEAGACGTPAVASNVIGHRDSVLHEMSGLLAEPGHEFTAALVRVLVDSVLRERLARGAMTRAGALTWDATAAGTLAALVDEARSRR